MRSTDIIALASERGCYLYVEGGKLRFKAPEGALTDELKALLVAHREEIIEHLTRIEQQLHTRKAKLPDLRQYPHGGLIPLSHSQQRLWFIDRLDEGSVQYNLPSAFSVRGAFDPGLFTAAIRVVVRRHDVLRACFGEEKGKPYLVVRDDPPLPIHSHDLRSLPEDQRRIRVRQLMSDDACTAFRLDRDVMLRVSIARIADDEYVILFNMHHIVSDAWSLGILIDELSQIYAALTEDRPHGLPSLKYQYHDYAHWQHEWLRGEVLQEQLEYWKKRLRGAPALHELPLTHARPERQSFEARMVRIDASVALTMKIEALCRSRDVTLFMFLQTAFAVLIGRYSTEEDIVMGTPVAGRFHRDLEPLIGFFVNVLVLRTDLGGTPTFDALLMANKANIVDAFNNQYVSFDMLVEELKPSRSLSHSPIFQIMLTMQQKGNRHISLGSLDLQLIDKVGLRTPYDLELSVLEEQQLQFSWKYSDSLFDEASISSMAENFLVLLDSIVDAPGRPIRELQMVSAEEMRKISAWRSGESHPVMPADAIHVLIRRHAARAPNAMALHCGDASLTFAQLDALSDQLAHRLAAEDVGAGSLVGLCLERTPDLLISMLAVLKTGAAYLPIDPHHPEQRVAYMLVDADVRLVLTQLRSRDLFSDKNLTALYIDGDNFKASLERFDGSPLPERLSPGSDLAYVIYTSGSTGKPKGVMVEHRQLANFHHAMAAVIDMSAPGPVWLAVTNYCFDISILELLCSLAFGFTVVLADDQHIQASCGGEGCGTGSTLADLMERHCVTHLQSTPSLLSMFVGDPAFAAQLRGLRQLLIGGEALSPALVGKLSEYTEARLLNMYGPTETTIWSTCGSPQPGQSLIDIGRPIGNTQIYVLDEAMGDVPIGVPGELCIGGAGVARGYLHRPELTAERFVVPPWTKERLYRTGDKAYWRPDGTLGFLGRFDHQIKLRGFRIELGEIESALGSHPTVAVAAVLLRVVGGEAQLVAYLVAAGGSVPMDDARQGLIRQIKADLAQTLPGYMIPAIHVFLPAMPLTNSGKIDRKALPEPDDSDRSLREYSPPRNDLERMLCEIWQGLLGLQRIGIEDNFFELGGHSLLSTQLISLVRESMGIEVGVAALFEHPTVASFAAEVLAQQTRAALPSIEPVSQRSNLPLSYAQQRLWVIDQLEGNSAQYNMPYGFKLKGGIDRDIVERTIRTIVERHESLRTRFYEVDGEVRQHVDSTFDFRLVQRDLSDLPNETQRSEVKRISIEDEKTPFNLSRDLMIRAQLLILSGNEHVLLFNMHHIASDGWSMKLLVLEFYRIYSAYLHGRYNPLPPLALQYGDYSSWQRGWLKGEVLDRQLRYWRQRLEGIPCVHRIPLDKPRPRRQTFNGDSVATTLDAPELNRIRSLCQRYGVTMFMFMQTLFSIVLNKYSGQRDVVMSTVVAGRGHKDIEPIIGFFLNTIVLRTDIDESSTFERNLLENKRHIVDAYSHQHVPFDTLVEHLQPPRSPRYNPIFQVMISLLDDKNEGMALSQADLQLEIVKRRKSTAKFELVLNMTESAKAMKISLVYNTDLFLAETAKGMIESLTTLAAQVVASPQTIIGDLPHADSKPLTSLMDGPFETYSTDTATCAAYSARVAADPAAIALAVLDHEGRHSLTWRDLDADIQGAIRQIDDLDSDAPVAVFLSRHPSVIAACIAVVMTARPLLLLSEKQDDALIARALADSGAMRVFGHGSTRVRELAADAEGASRRVIAMGTRVGAAEAEGNIHMPTIGTRPLALIYERSVSGAIRQRKIAVDALAYSTAWCREAMAGRTVLSLDDDAPTAWLYSILSPLLRGMTVAIPATLDDRMIGCTLREIDFTDVIVAVETLPHLLDGVQWHSGTPPASIVVVDVGAPSRGVGEAMSALPDTAIWARIDVAPTVPLLFRYTPVPSGADARASLLPQGMTAQVRDLRGREAPVGCFGSLWIAPAVACPPGGFSGFVDTGLQARRRSDGGFEIDGPRGEQWIAAEGRVDASRLSRRLSAIDGVRIALVRAEGDEGLFERISCHVLTTSGDRAVQSAIEVRARRVLAEFAQETAIATSLVVIDELSVMPDGAVDVGRLPAAEARADRHEASGDAASETQRTVLNLWQKVLGAKAISTTDNFFAVGGNSLLMILAIKKIAESFDVDIPMATFMASATIEELSYLIDFAIAQRQSKMVDTAVEDGGDMEEFIL